jgi:hypothetical protein
MSSTPPRPPRNNPDGKEDPPKINRPGLEGKSPRRNNNQDNDFDHNLTPPPTVYHPMIPDDKVGEGLGFLESGVQRVQRNPPSPRVARGGRPRASETQQEDDDVEEELQGLSIVNKKDCKEKSSKKD